jgi:hypothetical protein
MFPGVNEIMKRGAERGGNPAFIVFHGASPRVRPSRTPWMSWTCRGHYFLFMDSEDSGVAELRHEDGNVRWLALSKR